MSYAYNKGYLSKCEKYFLKPGYIYITKTPSVIATVLGSCICVCLYDTKIRYGGMNHFIFPRAQQDVRTSKYGDVSTIALYRAFKEFGSSPENIVAQIVGGAHFEGNSESEVISSQNISVCKKILGKLKIKILSEDTGGVLGRKILYITEYNELIINKLKGIRKSDYY